MEIFDRPMPSDDAYRTSDIQYRRSLDDTVDLREVLTKLWTRKRLILASVLICAGLAFIAAKLTTPTYTAGAFVVIKPEPAPATVDSLRAALQGGILASPEAVQTEAFVLQSRPLAGETIARLHLDQDPEFDPSLRKPNPILALFSPVVALFDEVQSRLRPVAGFLSGQADAPVDSDEAGAAVKADEPSTVVVDNFAKRLHVTVQERSNVIQVSFSSSHPAIAALVPNTLIGLYLEQRVVAREKAVAREKERLESVVLPALRQKMQASELALEEYRQKSGLVSDQNPTVLAQEVTQTEAQLAVARAHTAETVARLSQIQATGASMSGTVSAGTATESPILQSLKQQDVELQTQLSAVRVALGPNHPRTLQLEAQLKKVEDGMRHEGAGFVGRLKAELAAAQATEASLNKRVAEFTHQFAQVNGGDTRLQNLMVQAEADHKTYAQYLAASNEAYSSIAHPEPDASLLSHADVPVKPSFPSIRMMVMIGIALGAGAGIVLALMIDRLRGGLRSKEQVEQELGVRCLGSVPKLERFRGNRLLLPWPQRGSGAATLLQPQKTRFGQAIRSIELKLLSFDSRLEARVILVTAALPDEGKTLVAASLATSLAADGFSVALVDCDLYRPTIHRMFDGLRGPGLTDYFAGGIAFEEIVHKDPLSGVSYVPAGTAQSKDAWRITSTRLHPLINRLTEKYAFVILDSAPVLAVSETILLSQIAQRTIFVVKWGSTPPAIARHAAMQLLESGGAEIGVLLSMVDAKRAAKFGDPVAGAYKKLESYYGR
jgi:polysaccharide biosynthesis transport protein